MKIRMKQDELALLTAALRSSDKYLEFGTGGSTVLACETVRISVLSVESDQAWTEQVEAECVAKRTALTPEFLHVDIGPTGAWGKPTDASTRDRWPAYHASVWNQRLAKESDLILIDGRFRVACCAQSALNVNGLNITLSSNFYVP